MTLQEISDRFEITDLLTDYCSAIDSNDIDSLDKIFTADACIDYSRAGGPKTDLKTIKDFLKKNLGDLPRQHMLTNIKIDLQGDSASVRALCYNPLELPSENGNLEIAMWGIWYNDKLIRTTEGWRITHKITEPCYSWKIRRIKS